MKIKNIKSKNSLIKLKFLETKSYNEIHFLKNLKIEDIFYRLVKSFKILFKYHTFNKRILFLNSNIKIYIKLKILLKKTNHFYRINNLKQKSIIKNKNNLLVIIEQSTNNHNFFKINNYQTKIPNIIIINNIDYFFNIKNYKIIGNFFKQNQDQFFFVLLRSLLKK